MIYEKFSEKQVKLLTWWGLPETKEKDAIIAYGSVRSGKTLTMTLSYIIWSMGQFNNQNFAICGKTVKSVIRNIIINLREWLPESYKIETKLGNGMIIITYGDHTNIYYIFGGKDESSYAAIQGLTLAGVFLDEVALMPESFVNQALARCSVSGSRFWFNCNPEGPEHWFKKEWIDKNKNQLVLHFIMEDNLSLDPKVKKRLENSFSDGVFKDRYIKGLWSLAEGLVYPSFNKNENVFKEIDQNLHDFYVAMDYGIQNPTAFLLIARDDNNNHYVLKEYYHNGRKTNNQKTDQDYLDDLIEFIDGYNIKKLIVDPSASSFITLAQRELPFGVWKAKNNVIDGIQRTSEMLNNKRLLINNSCKNLIGEFGMYTWDSKGGDKVIKEHDHALDALRYYVMTTYAYREKEEYVPLYRRGMKGLNGGWSL